LLAGKAGDGCGLAVRCNGISALACWIRGLRVAEGVVDGLIDCFLRGLEETSSSSVWGVWRPPWYSSWAGCEGSSDIGAGGILVGAEKKEEEEEDEVKAEEEEEDVVGNDELVVPNEKEDATAGEKEENDEEKVDEAAAPKESIVSVIESIWVTLELGNVMLLIY
jgi:hypothetical protein